MMTPLHLAMIPLAGKEDKRMRLWLDAKSICEDDDDILEDDGPVNEVEEFMLIAGGGEDGEDVIDNHPPC
jgi:hypothetical protein